MDLLRTAVVDITTLTATYRALTHGPLAGTLGLRHRLRDKLRAELKRGVEAYIDALARSRHGVVDAGRLAAVRVAAEREMPRALRHQADLRQVMKTAPGSLFGVAAARQDLWRLAHMAIHLRQGVTSMQAARGDLDRKSIKKAGALLRRRLTRGLIAYARASQRVSDNDSHMMVVARKAALLATGKRAVAQAANLGQLEADGGTTHALIRSGVVKPLADLVLDWGPLETGPSRELS
jgi:hypothetical protein